ncbi:restriction endonuclease subunit S [Methylomonas sp. EFPC1]|nr:restriction endonuclease subunit S [Methylomonas sp. EFPC1]
MATGTTFKEISGSVAAKLPLILAPANEQKRIADKLDAVLAQVDACRDRLDRIPAIIKRFRQSVLVDAVTGKLTAEFRKSSEYSDTDLGWELPDCWDLLTISDVAEVKGGKRLPKGKLLVSRNTGFPYIRAGQLKDGTVIPDEQLYLEADVQSQIARYIVKCGDVYITIVGACIGDAGVIPPSYDGANLTENAAKLCDFKKVVSSQFLAFWLRSQLLQDIIQKEIKSGAQGKLALMRIKTLPLPYPPFNEQTEIVRRVESLFAYADRLEARYHAARAQVEKLIPALLAKAFRGELVPQDPNDEPAIELLARIVATKADAPPKKRAGKQLSNNS